MSKYFAFHQEVPVQNPEPGTIRRVMGYSDKLMVCELQFQKGGGNVNLHSHPHDQITYIVSGELEFTVGEDKATVHAGDVVYMPGGTKHGVTAVFADSTIVDTFAPKRDDFLK